MENITRHYYIHLRDANGDKRIVCYKIQSFPYLCPHKQSIMENEIQTENQSEAYVLVLKYTK